MYPQMDLFLLLVDNDGLSDRRKQLEARESDHPKKLIGCAAIEEIEVWLLALYPQFHKGWKALRADCHPKETYCQPFLYSKGWQVEVGGGYKRAMKAIKDEWKGLLQRCPELSELLERLREHPALSN
jgi:hypothetical protein